MVDVNGNVMVKLGDCIFGIFVYMVKLWFDYVVMFVWDIGVNVIWCGGVYVCGDENNGDVNGWFVGYVLVDFDMCYWIMKWFEVFVSVMNLFDKCYVSFGVFG